MNMVLAFIGFIAAFALTATLGDLLSEEIRSRLDRVPFTLLRLAACRLPAKLRAKVHDEEWVPEMHRILRGHDARPITRLYHGVRFAVGLWWAAPTIASELDGRSDETSVDWTFARWLRS